MKNLRLFTCGLKSTPSEVMRGLGLTWSHSVSQGAFDQHWYFNVSGKIPEPLPDFLSEIKIDPHQLVGYGLSQDDADAIVKASTLESLKL